MLKNRLESLIQDITADHRMLDGPERDQAAEFTRQVLLDHHILYA